MTPTAPNPNTAIPPVDALSNPPTASNAVSSGISSPLLLLFVAFLFPEEVEEETSRLAGCCRPTPPRVEYKG
jgi:hypothetical protein